MTGKQVRLARLFARDRRSVVVALDHAQFRGPLRGLTPIRSIVELAVEGGADGVILNPGALPACAAAVAGRCGLIVRVTGASTDRNPTFDFHRTICSIPRAVALGADAVIAMGFVGGTGEAQSLAQLAELAEACCGLGVPLIAEMLPVDAEHFSDPEWIALAVRAGAELGADVIKAYTTGTDADCAAIDGCGVPFLAAGGLPSQNAIRIAEAAIQHGAAGVAFGRNVFEAADPSGTVRELVRAVHGAVTEGEV